jgi:FkbM family methyltransferase
MVAVASRLVGQTGQVVAFEPDPENLLRLRRTIELNDLQNVTVRDVALSDRVGESQFFPDSSSSKASLEPRTPGASPISVRTSTIDEELKTLPSPALVKIDVEGHESRVLAGGTHLLGGAGPDMIIEVLTQVQRSEVARSLVGYETSMLDDRNLLARPVRSNVDGQGE